VKRFETDEVRGTGAMNARRQRTSRCCCRATGLRPAEYILEMIDAGFARTEDIAAACSARKPKTAER